MCAANDVPAYDLPDEGWDRRDESCDQCLAPMYGERPKGGLWICAKCRERNEARYAAMTAHLRDEVIQEWAQGVKEEDAA